MKKSKFLFSFHCSIDTLYACVQIQKWVSVCLWMWYHWKMRRKCDEYLFVVPIFVQYLFLFIQHNPNISVFISGWCFVMWYVRSLIQCNYVIVFPGDPVSSHLFIIYNKTSLHITRRTLNLNDSEEMDELEATTTISPLVRIFHHFHQQYLVRFDGVLSLQLAL